MNILLLLLVELVGLIVFSGILKKFSGINVWHVYMFQQKEFGWIQLSEQLFVVENMFCSLAVACAIDFTLE